MLTHLCGRRRELGLRWRPRLVNSSYKKEAPSSPVHYLYLDKQYVNSSLLIQEQVHIIYSIC